MADGDRKSGKPLYADPFEELEGSILERYSQTAAAPELEDPSSGDVRVDPGAAVNEKQDPARTGDGKTEQGAGAEHPAAEHEIPAAVPAAAAEAELGDDFLETLIADIDSEVAQTFGSGAMPEADEEAGPEDQIAEQYVVFSMAGTDYAVHIDNLTEIGEPQKITPVPNVPDWVLGVANLRGEILSMVDLAAFFGIENLKRERGARMLVAKTSAEDMTLGLIVERVEGIRSLGADQMVKPGAPLNDQVTPYLAGVCEESGRLVGILDFDRVLQSELMRRI
jgi:purine-binding chemotaxis protein CheW